MLPFFTQGKIVAGFGRGSNDLGFPTANFADDVTDGLPGDFECGIYYGWATVDNGPVNKMVMSVGFNPFYGNSKKTMETHIIHRYDSSLHGCLLKVCVFGYIRPERNFNSIDELKAAIAGDIDVAQTELDKPAAQIYTAHNFFTHSSSTDSTDS
jgi:riboflavin kinase